MNRSADKHDQLAGDRRLVRLLEPLARNEWLTESSLEQVSFIRSNRSIPRKPVSYEPSIIIIAQGQKIGYVGSETYVYDPNQYLVLSVPLPFECETIASRQEPLLGVAISVDVTTVSELLLEMDDSTSLSGPVPRGIYSTALTRELTDATVRLLECLSHPSDQRVLGPQILREIIYRVLRGNQGLALRALAARHSHFGQIARVLKRIHTEIESDLDVRSLAQEAHMSVSSFHSTFKAVTASSPLQYVKSVRLHKARMLMIQDGLNATTAATRVGYTSPSQFSREFKRYFGSTPTAEAARMAARMGAEKAPY